MMDQFLLYYLGHFDKHCFCPDPWGEYTISRKPEFTLVIHKISKGLLESTELALGEAYMRGDIEIKGTCSICSVPCWNRPDRFSLDRNRLRNILYMSEKETGPSREVSSHYDLGERFL